MTELSVEEFNEVLQINVIGVWLAIKHSVAAMAGRGGGSIIATASIAGVIGMPALGAYIASKHAVCGLVKAAALELGPQKIRVNAIAPGPIANRMIDSIEQQMAPGEAAVALHEYFQTLIALGRYGTNEEVANLALFLASDESSYTTGSINLIDGGFTAA
jgi:NAD(P)-dependent dehydrogenase (short-subunit alcohol dehydrogenase family)